MNATHNLFDEFRTPDRVRAHVVERIVCEGLALVDDFVAQGMTSEILEDLLPEGVPVMASGALAALYR